MAAMSKEAGLMSPSATLTYIWIRTPEMEEGNDVKLRITCGMHVSDVRSLAREKLSFAKKGAVEGELEVVTLAGYKLETKKRVSDLTEDTLIVRIAADYPQKEPAPLPEPLDWAPPATPTRITQWESAESVEPATPTPTAPPLPPAVTATAPPPSPAATAVSCPPTLASFGGSTPAYGAAPGVEVPPDVVSKPAALVVHIDRVAPDLPDACLRKAVEERMGRPVEELEVIRSGVSDAARSQHFAFAYAFAFLPGPPPGQPPPPQYADLSHSPATISVSHRDVSGRVTRLGAGQPLDFEWEDQVRLQATNKTRSMPRRPEPRATLHIRVFARINREEGSGWSERLESIKWPGFLALLEAACEIGAPGTLSPTGHIKMIADDKGSQNASTHPRVLLCGFFVQCHSVEGASTLMEAVNDQRVCCEGVAFLLRCDYTQKEKKLYDRCGRRETYKTFYAQYEQKYEEARTKAKDAVKEARDSRSLGRMLGEAHRGDFFTFGDRQSYNAGMPPESLPGHRQFSIAGGPRTQRGSSPAGMSGGPTGPDAAMATAPTVHSGMLGGPTGPAVPMATAPTGPTVQGPDAEQLAQQIRELQLQMMMHQLRADEQWAHYVQQQLPMQQSLAQPAYQPVLGQPALAGDQPVGGEEQWAYYVPQQLPMQQSQQPMWQQLQPQ